MRKQLATLANLGCLGKFIGMVTDSRSFLSYPRHEYFRRILCEYIGDLVEEGKYPRDMEFLKISRRIYRITMPRLTLAFDKPRLI